MSAAPTCFICNNSVDKHARLYVVGKKGQICRECIFECLKVTTVHPEDFPWNVLMALPDFEHISLRAAIEGLPPDASVATFFRRLSWIGRETKLREQLKTARAGIEELEGAMARCTAAIAEARDTERDLAAYLMQREPLTS